MKRICAWHCCQRPRDVGFLLCAEHTAIETMWGRIDLFRATPSFEEMQRKSDERLDAFV